MVYLCGKSVSLDAIAPHIESLIFAADRPVSIEEIQECLELAFDTLIPPPDIMEVLTSIIDRYQSEEYSFGIVQIAGGYQFMTKPAYHQAVNTYLRQTSRKRLSAAALETLAIIAYKQPVTKSELEAIRGVSCDYSLQKLLEKDLIAITGRSETVGKPLLYGTSEKFMDYFGLKSLQDLPKLRDFKAPEEEIGEAPSIDEVVEHIRAGQKAVAEVIDPEPVPGEPSAQPVVRIPTEEE